MMFFIRLDFGYNKILPKKLLRNRKTTGYKYKHAIIFAVLR